MNHNAKFCLTMLLVSAVCLSGMTIAGLAQEEPVTEDTALVLDSASGDAVTSTVTPSTGTDAIVMGDVNGDGLVDLKDVTLLFQYVNGQIGLSKIPNTAAMDVTGDGTPDLKDVTKLFQYVNGQISKL